MEWYYSSNQSWGGSGTDNTGNVLRADHWVPQANGALGSVTYDYYGYDGLNRVSSTTEYAYDSSNSTVTFRYTQAFAYDQWGNRTINQAGTTTSPDINKREFTVNTATNRLGVPSGQSGALDYDDIGNLSTDTYTETDPNKRGAMLYDAENHMTSAINGSHQYRYNADGKRVKRIITGTGGGEFWMVYGMGGELVAEYNATSGIPAQTNPSKEYGYRDGQMLIVAEGTTAVKWLIQDHLGSTRMEIGLAGNIGDVMRHDYFPFGEEIAGALRSATYGYGGATNTKQKFTGYERDDETGLDYAQARYMSSKQGRFTSVDPDGIGAAISEPQSWNGYAYVGNRPTVITDPSGLLWLQHRNANGGIDIYKWVDGNSISEADVADNWEMASSLSYYAGGEIGYVALDFHSNRWIGHHESKAKAQATAERFLNEHDPAAESQNVEAVNQMLIFSGATNLVTSLGRITASTIGQIAFSRMAQRSVAQAVAGETMAPIAQTGVIKLSQFTASTLENAAALTIKQKGTHIFANKLHPKPYLDQLAQQMGGRQNLVKSALEAGNGKFPSSGIFEFPINVGGQGLTIRGFVNNGLPIINTIFK